MATSVLALANQSQAQSSAGRPREYYEIRRYHLQTGPQVKLTEDYLANALIPALNRMGIAPVGAFHLDIGPDTPTLYLLLPCAKLDTLVSAELQLAHDEQFQKAAAAFWSAPATAPAFQRIDSSLHVAFEGWPKLTLPAATAEHGKRIFQLRTYESPSSQAHVRKVEMFHHGEFDIFQRAGFSQIFYSDTLIGPRMPNLTYMLGFADLTDLNAKWDKFRADPEWIKLKSSPRYGYEEIVSNISNLILSPTAYSQV
ncbi:NIPSNAP family protein [Granulicella sp. S190]|uniref:NIPSNAP family protein n=1 Tax=Granulicella sp. S190 TaxID=1747226 RepID=UPI0020B13542|nr:NIPSNAP family protein [Granulicella sp. S190]